MAKNIARKRTFRLVINVSNRTVEEMEMFSLGTLSLNCCYCNAKYFVKETLVNRQGIYFTCCNFGKVELPLLSECPEILRELLTKDSPVSVNFISNIRAVNANFAMASFRATLPNDKNVSQGAWCFHVTGQIYHHIPPFLICQFVTIWYTINCTSLMLKKQLI